MAYLGRKGASAALTSADIPNGSISAVKVAADVATQAEIDLKANLASPTLTTPNLGTPSAVTLTNATFPAGHVLQVVRHETTGSAYVTSSGTTEAWEADGNDLHITVTAGNLVVAWIGGGMINAETGVVGYWTKIRFSENSGAANQDKWTSTHIGGDFTPDLYHPATVISASVVAAHTGLMLIKRGSDNSGATNTAWASDGTGGSYGPVHYLAMEIQV